MAPQEKIAESLKQIATLKEAFADAEAKESQCQQLIGQLNTIMLNQLRYAGFHLLAAMKKDGSWDEDKIEEELELAINHCNRARCDSMDILASKLLYDCREFKQKYWKIKEVFDLIPNYNEMNNTFIKAQELIRSYNGRKQHNDINYHYELQARIEHIKTLEPCIKELIEIHDKFLTEGPKIDILYRRNKAESILMRFVMPVLIGIFTTIISNLILYFNRDYIKLFSQISVTHSEYTKSK